eukprot:gb/GEZN01013866.1/.p1 GENE.gb/GEZN01013866.1/~~gb/GEZN01013866.1/.p1  ORF type:complete len:257 (-),score=10.42 gb/GEZN01013866.1/:111-881(-)
MSRVSLRKAIPTFDILACLLLGISVSATPRKALNYAINSPAATAITGCRSPEETNCEVCCRADAEACMQFSAQGFAEYAPDTTPWYNVQTFLEGACPEECPPCASCLIRDEEELTTLGERPECDCSLSVELDPCFSPNSCECYCSRYLRLAEACPHLVSRPTTVNSLVQRLEPKFHAWLIAQGGISSVRYDSLPPLAEESGSWHWNRNLEHPTNRRTSWPINTFTWHWTGEGDLQVTNYINQKGGDQTETILLSGN